MQKVCSYCRAPLGECHPYEDTRISHGMCEDCHAHFRRQWRGVPLRAVLEEFDAPVVVVDGDRRVLAANRLTQGLFGRPAQDLRGLLTGEAAECVHSRQPGGCGGTVHCRGCAIRRTLVTARETGRPTERVAARLERDDVTLDLRVSAYPEDGCTRLVIEEVVPVQRSAPPGRRGAYS